MYTYMTKGRCTLLDVHLFEMKLTRAADYNAPILLLLIFVFSFNLGLAYLFILNTLVSVISLQCILTSLTFLLSVKGTPCLDCSCNGSTTFVYLCNVYCLNSLHILFAFLIYVNSFS